MCVAWLVHTCDMTHLHVCLDSDLCVISIINMCDLTWTLSYVWHDSFIRVTWLIHMCGLTQTYVWHDSLKCVIWLDSFICVTWLVQCVERQQYHRHVIHTCDMTLSYVWVDSFIRVAWLTYLTHLYVKCLIHIWHVSLPYSFCSSRLDYLPGCAFTLEHLIHSCDWFICLINMWHDSFIEFIYMWHVSSIP